MPLPLRMPAPACSGQQFLTHHRRVAAKLKARPLTSSAVPPRDAAALPSTRAAGGAASMHTAYEEEDERVLQHASEEELACHCRLHPRGGGAHGGCRSGSRSGARRACKPGADAESTFERCECANDRAWVRHRQMSICCVYMRERSSSLLVCMCVWERETERETERRASVTQQPSLSIRPSLARSHATHASTAHFDTLTRPLPTSRPAQSLCEYPFLSLGLFSLNISHTQRERETHAAQHTHTHSPEHTIHPHPRLYGDHSRLCFFAPPTCTTPQSSKRAMSRSKTVTTPR